MENRLSYFDSVFGALRGMPTTDCSVADVQNRYNFIRDAPKSCKNIMKVTVLVLKELRIYRM